MNIRHLSALLCAAAIVSIAGCGGGGGGNDSGCGEKSQSFAIEFEIKSFTLPIGKPATLQSVLTPESCRSSMKLNLSSGDFPTGMTLDNGNEWIGIKISEDDENVTFEKISAGNPASTGSIKTPIPKSSITNVPQLLFNCSGASQILV